MKFFQNKTITYIHLIVMAIMFVLVLIFIALVIHKEYTEFNKEAKALRVSYIEKQKNTVYFDVNRVLNFIKYEYENRNLAIEEEELKRKLVKTIETLYGREDGTGYIFIYDFDGLKISDPVWPHDIGENLYNLKDVNGVQVIKELIDLAKSNGDGFVEYTWRKPETYRDSLKISHAKAFEPWQWMIGTGIYLNEVEKLIEADKKQLRESLIVHIMEIVSLSILLFVIGLIGIVVINRVVSREIHTFRKFFQKASKSYVLINPEEVYLQGFKKMVAYINNMVKEIHKRNDELANLNISLEEKVKQKTKDLNELVQKQDNFIKHSIHEINTPLAVIITNLDIVKIKMEENKYLSKIEAATKMIGTIYDDLSYMVKKDRFVYEKQSFNFCQVLTSRVDFFQEIALGNQLEIVTEIQKELHIYFNEVELQRIIDNNLSNAIKYAKRKTFVIVELKELSEQIVLKFITKSTKIEDTQSIFEPFHQAGEKREGFGLGLEIVASICDKNSVKIDVSSDEIYTVFSYYFTKEMK
jgi:signal transduction histidine kinase